MTKLNQRNTNFRVDSTAGLAAMTNIRNGDLTSLHVGPQAGQFRYNLTGRSGLDPNAETGLWYDGPGGDDYWQRTGQGAVNACWFDGVDPTGATDSYSGLQNALDFISGQMTGATEQTASGGLALYIPGGLYVITQGLVVPPAAGTHPSSFARIFGDGHRRTIIRADAAATSGAIPYMITFSEGGGTSNSGWTMDNIGWDCKIGAGMGGIDALKSSYFHLDNCGIYFGAPGLRLHNWSNVITRNRIANGVDNIFIPATGGITNQINDLVLAYNSLASPGDYCLRVAAGKDVTNMKMIYNQFDGSSKAAINFGGYCENLSITRNYFEGMGQLSAVNQTAIVQRTTDNLNPENASGAIVCHPPSDSNVGISGDIKYNHFQQCNTVNHISISGCRNLVIDRNTFANAAQVQNFVNFQDPTQLPTGPLPYSQTQHIRIDGSCTDQGGTRKITRLVNWDKTDLAGISGIQVIERGIVGVNNETCRRTFVLNDLTDAGIWNIDTSSTAPVLSYEGGQVAHSWDDVDDPVSVTATFTKHARSPLSGAYIKFYGDVRSPGGQVLFRCTVTDGGRTPESHAIAYYLSGSAGYASGREGIMYLEPVTGTTTETVTIRVWQDAVAATEYSIYNFCICSASIDPNQIPTLNRI